MDEYLLYHPKGFRAPVKPQDAGRIRATMKELSGRVTESNKSEHPDGIDSDRVLDFVLSDEEEDRDGDIIRVDGWDTADWEKNPVVLWVHSHRDLPIARGFNLRKEKGQLRASAEFVTEDTYKFAETIFRMFKEGFLNATSVGFRPTEWEMRDNENPFGGIEFVKQELLEWSAVPVPANPRALLRAHDLGIRTEPLKEWCEQVLDHEKNTAGLAIDKVERAYKYLCDSAPFVFHMPAKMGGPALTCRCETTVALGPDPVDPATVDPDPVAEQLARIAQGGGPLVALLDKLVPPLVEQSIKSSRADWPEDPPECLGCGQRITGKVTTDAGDRSWHEQCMREAVMAIDDPVSDSDLEIDLEKIESSGDEMVDLDEINTEKAQDTGISENDLGEVTQQLAKRVDKALDDLAE